MGMFIFTQSRVKEEELLKSVECFSNKILSTFDLIFDELRINDQVSKFIPSLKGNDCGEVITFNFKLKKEEVSTNNFKYTFEHGKNTVIIESKFPLSGQLLKEKSVTYFTELVHNEDSINYLNLIKKYLDYYVLDRDTTYILKDGNVVNDSISDQDFKNREKSGYSYIGKKPNILRINAYQNKNVGMQELKRIS